MRYVSPLKRARLREAAYTVQTIAVTAFCCIAVLVAAVVLVGAIHIVIGIW